VPAYGNRDLVVAAALEGPVIGVGDVLDHIDGVRVARDVVFENIH
jgi:hypothetical protein